MRTLQIGDRKISDMKPEEFVDFIYEFGYCLHDKYWDKPVLMEFGYYKPFNHVYFTFYQLRKDDGIRKEKTGHIHFGEERSDDMASMGMYMSNNDKAISDPTSYTFRTKAINHFIKLGFDLPLYSE